METSLDKKKIELIQWLASIEDFSLLERINDIRSEIDSAWANESEARIKAIKTGKMQTYSVEEVFSYTNK